METGTDFIFLGSKIIADGDGSHEINRRLLLGRKAMTNLDSILKSRDNTLLKKVRLVKTIVFPVFICGWENWSIKKAKWQRTEAFELWCWKRESLGLQGDSTSPSYRKSVLNIHLEGLMLKLKLQYFGHLMGRTDSVEKTLMLGKSEGRKRRGTTEDEMVGWHHRLNGHEFDQALRNVAVHTVTKNQTLLSDWTYLTELTLIHRPHISGSYAILSFTASDFTVTTRYNHNWASFLLWPSHFILSGVISNCPLLLPSSILDTFITV